MSLIPTTIALATYGLFVRFTYTWITEKMHSWLQGFSSTWASVLFYIAIVLTVLLLAGLIATTFAMVVGFIASPFEEWISEMTDHALHGQKTEHFPFSLSRWMRLFVVDLKKTFFILIFGLVLSTMAGIPVLGWLTLPAFAWLTSLQFLAYPVTRRNASFGSLLSWTFKHLPESLGLGTALTIGLDIPIVNAFALPVAAIAATWLHFECREIKT